MSHTFESTNQGRRDWQKFTYNLLEGSNYPLFKLDHDRSRSLGFRLQYGSSALQNYLAISHSWTDRTGSGNSIAVQDLAPWELTISPSKVGLLKWLFHLQETTAESSQAVLWYWFDLFCIDQSCDDNSLFARQVQQIPQVFAKADGCIAIIASKSCKEAKEYSLPARSTDEEDPHFEWFALRNWLIDHHRSCNCTPLTDAWLTRVWTRQELLYSSNIVLCPATEWLDENESLNPEIWTSHSTPYHAVDVGYGLDEFASCLITWAEKHRRTYSSTDLVKIAMTLMRGHSVAQSACDLRESASPEVDIEEWFSFNWAMILNGSIRRTTKARDAILSQMLLLPGYVVPPLTPSTTLQYIAHDASVQFRRLVKYYQLVPLDLRIWNNRGKELYRAIWNETAPQPRMADVLEAVGSPCQISVSSNPPPPDALSTFMCPSASLMVYEPLSQPRYEVLSTLDLVGNPLAAIPCFRQIYAFWTELSTCDIESRVRVRLKALCGANSNRAQEKVETQEVSSLMQEIVWYMLQGWKHKFPIFGLELTATTKESSLVSSKTSLKHCLPPLTIVWISYKNQDLSPHVNLLFGDLEVGSRGEVLGLGFDKGIQREIGIIGDMVGEEVHIRAFGAIMAKGLDGTRGSRTAWISQAQSRFFPVKGERNTF